ncbi:MAG: UDP-3-O-acylglucosamine N-acyltransferase [Chlamydiae bacterium]|nr:UDP-3-O-acylglucosamine N-acyltransferase [Chlamydiota bacterium]
MEEQKTCYTIAELAQITSSEIVGNPNHQIFGIDDLESATSNDASFLANSIYVKALKKSNAGVVFVNQPLSDNPVNQLINPSPSKAFQQIIDLFHSHKLLESGFKGVHPSATIHPSAKIASNVTIGPNVTIDQNATIGSNTIINPNACIGPNVIIGKNCIIHSQVTIREHCQLGDFVIVQPGAVIGACGFGYLTDQKGHHKKIQHTGTVILEDYVEIGACTCIDRGRFKETIVEKGAKIDNLVQIAHGVKIGAGSMVISQSGIAGSTILGKYNIIAGQVGIIGHLKFADHVTVAARGAVTKSLTKPGRYGGNPAVPAEKYHEKQMHQRRLYMYANKIKILEKKLEELEKRLDQ